MSKQKNKSNFKAKSMAELQEQGQTGTLDKQRHCTSGKISIRLRVKYIKVYKRQSR